MNNISNQKQIQSRVYGTSGPYVILLHGGPGAPGYMAAIARQLAGSFRILEPFQRGSGTEQLTVARHVADLHEFIKTHCRNKRPAIVGHSWGAMLALAYAAEYPDSARSLALIGCGTFDAVGRDRLQKIRKERMDDDLSRCMEQLNHEFSDPDKRLAVLGRLIQQIDSYELISTGDKIEEEECDARAHQETWQDMLRLQQEGVYPEVFAKINIPVIMMHGAYDPHPGRIIQASLKPYLPQLEYHQWEHSGHYPWLERAARNNFYTVLRQWLLHKK